MVGMQDFHLPKSYYKQSTFTLSEIGVITQAWGLSSVRGAPGKGRRAVARTLLTLAFHGGPPAAPLELTKITGQQTTQQQEERCGPGKEPERPMSPASFSPSAGTAQAASTGRSR